MTVKYKTKSAKPTVRARIDPNTDDENWRTRGRCFGHSRPELWFPVSEDGSEFGVWLCWHCPVMVRCREESLVNEEPHGTWGALSEWDRQRIYGISRAR